MKLENSDFVHRYLDSFFPAKLIGVFILPLFFVSSISVCAENCCSTNDIDQACRRLESAHLLTDEATRLSRMNNILTRWSWCVAALEKETPHVDVEEGSVTETHAAPNIDKTGSSKFDPQNFQKLLNAYQDARRHYLQHKLLYDQHVTEFHNQPHTVPTIQPSSGSAQPPSWAAPHLPALRLTVEDACSQLQMAEGVLFQTENELSSMVNYIIVNKNKASPESYFQSWSSAQSLGASLQREVVEYGNIILRKQSNTEEQMHNLEQSAITNGDFVQSKNVYGELQRYSALNNEETKNAHSHTMFASMILSAIGSLSPLTAASVSPSNSASYISADEIQRESQGLQTEYDALQQQYRDAEKANPAFVQTAGKKR